MKSWTCADHGEFSSPLSLCPTCNRRAKRNGLKEIIESGTPPSQTRASFGRTNILLDETLRNQHLTNYSNATGISKTSFENEFQHESGLVTGYGKDFLARMAPGAQLAQLDMERTRRGEVGAYNQFDLSKVENLVATTNAGTRIGSAGHIHARSNVIAKDPGEYR